MAFLPFSSDRKFETPFITVDKYGRICLNAKLREKLGSDKNEVELFVFYEEETRRFGIKKEYLQGDKQLVKPYKFDKRGYTDARNLLNEYEIPYEEGAVRYFHQKTVDDMMIFSASRSYENKGLVAKMSPNGDIQLLKSS